MRFLLDTSVWLRAVNQPASIPGPVQALLEDAREQFGLSTISFWEVGKKHQTGKLPLPVSLEDWFKLAVTSRLELMPISGSVVADAMRLPAFPNRDPADELIVATARIHKLTLLTTDTQLKGYRHARVQYFKPLPEAV